MFVFLISCGTIDNPIEDKKKIEIIDNTSSSIDVGDKTDTEVPNKRPSIIGKWYYDSEDDRKYYNFLANGVVYYRYYRNLGNIASSTSLNSFVTEGGKWSYLNEEKTRFSIGWDGSIDCWYDIISEDNEKLVIKKNNSGPAGRGLGSVTSLLKNAKTVAQIEKDEFSELLGIWYYDETKDGKSLTFKKDGVCSYYYYQYYGEGLFSSLNCWIYKNGKWHYSFESKILTITINGEISYSYEIEILTSKNLKFKVLDNGPAGKSIVSSDCLLYK